MIVCVLDPRDISQGDLSLPVLLIDHFHSAWNRKEFTAESLTHRGTEAPRYEARARRTRSGRKIRGEMRDERAHELGGEPLGSGAAVLRVDRDRGNHAHH